jgi:hypothetical protein
MIEKSRFREKILSPHASSTGVKVTPIVIIVGCLCEEETYF